MSTAPTKKQPTEQDAIEAVDTLLRFIGEDSTRDGLIDTPKRMVSAYKEYFEGYHLDPVKELRRTFEDASGYDDMVLLKGISFYSHCEHHMAPIIGTAHVAYIPTDKIVGISKLARVVEIYAKRLQTQESMTKQLADIIEETLKPQGVAISISAIHYCMSMRGVKKENVATITKCYKGLFKESRDWKKSFEQFIALP